MKIIGAGKTPAPILVRLVTQVSIISQKESLFAIKIVS